MKLSKNHILLTFFALAILVSCGKDDPAPQPQEPVGFTGEVEFIKTFGGSNEDDAVSIVVANDGNFMVFGSTQSIDGDITDKTATDSDFWLLKLSPTGEKIWSKTYGGTSDERAARISKTNDGGFILSGFSRSDDGDVQSGNEGFHDYWVVKINNDGIIQWENHFGFSGSDQAFDAFQTTDGGYFVTGFLDVTASGGSGNDFGNGDGNGDTRNPQHGVGEYWAVKLDASGNKVWRRYFGGTNNDRSYDALQTADGGYLMVGASESSDFDITDDKGSYDFWAVRLNANGDKIWTKSFGGSEIDVAYAVTKTNDGNYLLVGDTRSNDKDVTNPKGNADAWAVKFNDNGDKIWQKTYGGSEFESARSIHPLDNGKYVIAGNTRSTNGDVSANKGQNDAWAYIIDANGTLEFQKTIGGTSLDFAEDVIETADNKLLIVGNTESNNLDIPMNRGIKDFLIIKLK